MLVARLYGTGDIRIGEEEPPTVKGDGEPRGSEVLVRVTAAGICGSDLHWWTEGAIGDARLGHPLVLGHEGAGVIESGPRAGQRVAIDPAITCGTCRACRDGYRNLCYRIRFSGHGDTDGMMRQVMAWPLSLLHPLPDSVSDAGGAMLEPLGVALWSLDLGHLPFGGTASVTGCGPIGLLLIQLLRAAGASRVIAAEPLAHRREAAARCGADLVLEPDESLVSRRTALREAADAFTSAATRSRPQGDHRTTAVDLSLPKPLRHQFLVLAVDSFVRACRAAVLPVAD